MSLATSHNSLSQRTFDLRVGPLLYRFESRDGHGNDRLRAIASHLCAAETNAIPDRTILLGKPADICSDQWLQHSSPLGAIAHRPGTTAAAWIADASPELPAFRYHLPWALIIADMARRNGMIVHAGFAARNDKGLLFLAPPGGGKSTTLAAAPSDWEILSDDAALLWPEQGAWRASPLPSWTMLTAPDLPAPAPRLFDLGKVRTVCGLAILAKEPAISLARMSPLDAAPHLYRALNEYHATVLTELVEKELFFRSACDLTRTLPCWRFGLPLGADLRPYFAALYEGAQ